MRWNRVVPVVIGVLGIATMALAYQDPCGTVINNYTACDTLRCKPDGTACCNSFILNTDQLNFCTQAVSTLPAICPVCP
jgi:hypothetical protein